MSCSAHHSEIVKGNARRAHIKVAQLDVRHTSSNRKIRIDIEAAQMLQQQMQFWLVDESMVPLLGTRTVERTNRIYRVEFCNCIADDVDPIRNDSNGAMCVHCS